jgi:hypothetical protein
MTNVLESAFNSTTAQSLKSTGSDTSIKLAGLPITVTSGVLKFNSGNSEEWVYFSGTTPATNTITGCVRGLDKDATSSSDATASNKKDHPIGTVVKLVAHSFQLNDKANLDTDNTHTAGETTFTDTTAIQFFTQSLTEAERDAATGAANGAIIHNETSGVLNQYIGGDWADFATGTTVNASETVAGKGEVSTTAESKAGTDTGGTGAKNWVLPSDIAANTQSGTFVYAADGEASDTYVITLTPTLTAYTEGQLISFKANTANTGAATLNVDTLGAKTIKKFHDQDLEDGDIEAGSIVDVRYDGTNFLLQTPVATQMSTADSATLTDTSNADALHSHTIGGGVGVGNGTASASGAFTVNTLSFTPRLIQIHYRYTDAAGNVDTVGNGQADATDNEQSMWHQDSNAGTASGVSTTAILSPGNLDADTWTGDLSAISSSGFTITLTKANTPTDISIHWTAFA